MRVADAQRSWFAVDKCLVDRAEAVLVCSAVLDLLQPRLELVVIDAYCDCPREEPDDVAAAQRWLLARGATRRHGDPGLAIGLDPADAEHWGVIACHAPWSTSVDLCAAPDRTPIGALRECGHCVTALLSPHEAAELTDAVAGVGRVLAVRQARGRTGTRGARRTRRGLARG